MRTNCGRPKHKKKVSKSGEKRISSQDSFYFVLYSYSLLVRFVFPPAPRTFSSVTVAFIMVSTVRFLSQNEGKKQKR